MVSQYAYNAIMGQRYINWETRLVELPGHCFKGLEAHTLLFKTLWECHEFVIANLEGELRGL